MTKFTSYVHTFVADIRQSFLDLTIIIGVVAFFQFVVVREVPALWVSMLLGLVVVGVGLALALAALTLECGTDHNCSGIQERWPVSWIGWRLLPPELDPGW